MESPSITSRPKSTSPPIYSSSIAHISDRNTHYQKHDLVLQGTAPLSETTFSPPQPTVSVSMASSTTREATPSPNFSQNGPVTRSFPLPPSTDPYQLSRQLQLHMQHQIHLQAEMQRQFLLQQHMRLSTEAAKEALASPTNSEPEAESSVESFDPPR